MHFYIITYYIVGMKNKDARSLPSIAQEDIRFRAVKAVLDGKSQVEVAETLGVTRQAIGKWIKAYREGGKKALKSKRQGRPKGGTLLPWQSAQIVKTIMNRHPEQLKLPFYLWTRDAVGRLIEKRYGINLSRWTVGRYLKRWGFTPQKPVRQAYERNPEAVRRWLEEEYPLIRTRAKTEEATIYWGDEMGLRSDHAVGRSFSPRGKTPVIPGTGQRFRCNMISAITNRGQLNFMVFKERFCSDVFLDFLRRMVRQSDRKIFLITDSHLSTENLRSVHHAKKIQNWVENNTKRIQIFFLPTYSPELNPDELLNLDVKSNALGSSKNPFGKSVLKM